MGRALLRELALFTKTNVGIVNDSQRSSNRPTCLCICGSAFAKVRSHTGNTRVLRQNTAGNEHTVSSVFAPRSRRIPYCPDVEQPISLSRPWACNFLDLSGPTHSSACFFLVFFLRIVRNELDKVGDVPLPFGNGFCFFFERILDILCRFSGSKSTASRIESLCAHLTDCAQSSARDEFLRAQTSAQPFAF